MYLAICRKAIEPSLRIGGAYAASIWGLRDNNVSAKLWLAPVRDAISAAVWFAGFFTNKIIWRGIPYRVRNRLLQPLAPTASSLQAQGSTARGIK